MVTGAFNLTHPLRQVNLTSIVATGEFNVHYYDWCQRP